MRRPEPSAAGARLRRGDPAFAIRFWSAAVLAPVALAVAWMGGWPFGVFVALAGALMAYEWVRMSDKGAPKGVIAFAPAAVMFAILLAAGSLWLSSLVVLAAAAALGMAERRKRGSAWRAVVGALYIGLPCVALVWVRNAPERGFAGLLYLFAVVWAADIAAYLSGSWLGGPKLLPRASPNKTWTGLIFGLGAGALAGAAAFAAMGRAPLAGALLGLPVALSAVGGDLLESSFKRVFGVKDTGTIIPGHGGVLDRVDALMGAVVAFSLLIAFWPGVREAFFAS